MKSVVVTPDNIKKIVKLICKLPANLAEETPCNNLCADLIGPHTIIIKVNNKVLILKYVTIINPITGQFKIKPYGNKGVINIANLVKTTWMTICYWPTEIRYYQGS